MGYELNIVRDKNNRISLQEWQNYIAQDSEFKSISEYSASVGLDVLTFSTPDAGLWISEKGEIPFTFYEGRGEITVKNPDQWIIDKMIQISETLNAQVVGEEGEVYSKENPQGVFSLSDEPKSEKVSKRKWWQIFKKTKQQKKTFPYEKLIGASFYFEKNDQTYSSLIEFMKKLEQFSNLEITESIYHVEDFGISGTIKEIERDQEFKVGVILHTATCAENIMIIPNNNSFSVSFSIYNDLEKLLDLIELVGNKENLLLGSIYNEYDSQWQSETNIQSYEANQRKFKNLKFTTDVFDKKCIDVSHHPGRRIYGGGIMFVAGWKNWFGPKILRKLPTDFWNKPLFSNSEAEEDGIVITQLYSDPLVLEFEKSIRPKQKEVLQLLNIEKVLKEYEKNKFNENFQW